MSSILRSGKFIRCFASVARTFLNPHKTNENNLIQSVGARNLSVDLSQWNKHNTQQQTDSLEPLLQRLDSDVRKFGRLSRKDLDEMLEEIRQKHHVSSSQSLLIIRCCGDLVPEELPQVRTKLVKEIWNTLVERGVPMDISHYNALLSVYVENEHVFSPEELLKELEGKGIQPNRVTYQRLMWRYCQQGDVEGASRILELMRSNQLPLTSGILDALVLGHARLGDVAGARAVVTAMGSAGLEPGPRTYALLAGCSGSRGDTEELKKTLQECAEKEIYLSDKDYMDIIEDCATGGHNENIEFLLGQMQHSAGYNTDAITLILRLITLGHDAAALQVYRSLIKPANPVSDSGSSLYQGAFFIKQLIKAGRPNDIVISMCQELKNDGSIPMALTIAVDAAMFHGKKELALDLFELIKNSGEQVREHYFWPLIVAEGKAKKHKEILKLVNKMTSDYQIRISSETLRDYVLPYFKGIDPNHLFDRLREVNVPILQAGRMIVCSLLAENKLKSAAHFTVKYCIPNNLNMCRSFLIQELKSTGDIEPFVRIIHSGAARDSNRILQSFSNANEDSVDDIEDRPQEYKSTVGSIITAFVSQSQLAVSILPPLLEELHETGIGITVYWAEKIQDQLGGNMTNDISEALVKLTDENLEPKPFQTQTRFPIRRTAESLESIINTIESKGEQTLGLKKKLMMAYIAQKQTAKLEALLDGLTDEKFVFTAGTYVSLQEYYTQEKNLEKALMYYGKVKETEGFVIDDLKILRLANLLVSNQEYDKAIEIVKSQPGSRDPQIRSFIYNSLTWRILNTLADAGDVDKLHKMFNLLVEKEFVKENNVVLGPLVKIHLIKDDVQSALNEFERICKQYNCTPMKNELTKKLISMEDAAGLQKLTDLSTSIHGEVNSLYDLVFGFVECGRVRQARRILETPGMRTKNKRFISACERYAQEGKVDYLEGLLEATKELSHIDRTEVFQQLLNTYIKEENPEKALGLWTVIQEESEAPTDKFLLCLAEFLKSKNLDIPFVVPEKYEDVIIPKPESATNFVEQVKLSKENTKMKEDSKLLQALQKNNSDEALSIWKKSPKSVSRGEVSMLIEQLLHNAKSDMAFEVLMETLKANVNPYERILRYLLNHLAAAGEEEKIKMIGESLSLMQKKAVSFDNRKCNAMINAGKAEQIVDDLSNLLNTDADPEQLRSAFSAGAFLGMLTDSALFSKCVELAEKFATKGVLSPINMLWIHYVLNDNDDQAQIIWSKYLQEADNIMFKKILNESKGANRTDMIDKVLQYLKTSYRISSSALGIVYSAKLDILFKNSKLTEMDSTIQDALSSGCQLEHINTSSLMRMKKIFESSGQEFKYEIPPRRKIN